MQDFILQKSNIPERQRVTWGTMARRDVPRAPKTLGAQLFALRQAFSENPNQRSREVIVTLLKTHGVEIDQSSLFRYENKRHMPTVDVLWGLSKVYRAPFESLLVLALSGIDPEAVKLIKVNQLTNSVGSNGGVNVSAAARATAERERQFVQQQAEVAAAHRLAGQLVRILERARGKADAPAPPRSSRGRTARRSD